MSTRSRRHDLPSSRRNKTRSQSHKSDRSRRLLVEPLEHRWLLSGQSLLYYAVDDSQISPTNAGLVLSADLSNGRQVPMHAIVPYTGAGISGLAFLSGGQLYGTTSNGSGSGSSLVRINPDDGTEISRIAITGGISVADLAVHPTTNVLYALRSGDDGAGKAGEIYTIDTSTGAAQLVGRANAISSVEGGLAFGPDGTLYFSTVSGLGGPVLHRLNAANAAILSTITLTGSQGSNSGLTWWPEEGVLVGSGRANGDLVRINPSTGARTAISLETPARGVMGDLAFQPLSPTVVHVHHANFETGPQGYTAQNNFPNRQIPGYWHSSVGRSQDELLNHSLAHSWYYGAFETPVGNGNYSIRNSHRGELSSPVIDMPASGTSILSFSYLLETRPELSHDFVEVYVAVGNTRHLIRERAATDSEHLLEQTTRSRWLTSTYDVSEFNGQDIRVIFVFDTGDAPPQDPEGWYVDDVQISNFTEFGSVHGIKYNDVNDTGGYEPNVDILIPGVVFHLTEMVDANSNQVIDTYTATTNAQGRYEFPSVPPGRYLLEEYTPPEAEVPGDLFKLEVTVNSGEERVAFLDTFEIPPGQTESLLEDLAVPNTLYGSVHGFKFNDVNADGIFNTGDIPMVGVTMTLTEPQDWNGDGQLVYQAITMAGGIFEILNVYPGSYTLNEVLLPHVLPPATLPLPLIVRSGEELAYKASAAGTLKAGQLETLRAELAVPNKLLGSVHGIKFNDVNADGIFNAGDVPMAGITMTLTEPQDWNGDGRLIYEAVTMANGTFNFIDVYPGSYALNELPPPQVLPPALLPLALTIRSGEELVYQAGAAGILKSGQFETHKADLAVPNKVRGSIHGYKYNDVNNNGVHDTFTTPGTSGSRPEPYIQYVHFTLYRITPSGDVYVGVYETGADGRFEFTQLEPSQYRLVETTPADAAVPHSAYTRVLTVRSGEELVAEAGMAVLLPYQYETIASYLAVANTLYGSVHGMKFNDVNSDGIFNTGDIPMVGVTMTLAEPQDWNGDGQLVYEAITTAGGLFEFLNVYPGSYTLSEVLLPHVLPPATLPLPLIVRSGEELVYTANAAGVLKSGQFETLQPELSVPNKLRGSVHGIKYADENRNEQFDPGEEFPGVTMTLTEKQDWNGDGDLDTYQAVTGADGSFQFELVYPGTYTLDEVLPPGYARMDLPQDVTIISGQERVVPGLTITLLTGQFKTDDPNLIVGNAPLASITGRVWSDVNGNTQIDTSLNGQSAQGEAFIPGVKVTLHDSTGTEIDDDITDANGNYEFPGVPAGNYTVRVDGNTVPTGFELTTGFATRSITITTTSRVANFGYQGIVQFATALGFFRSDPVSDFVPFIRPADQPLLNVIYDEDRTVTTFIDYFRNTLSNPDRYQVFEIKNNSDQAITVTGVDIRTAVPQAQGFVRFYTRAQLGLLINYEQTVGPPSTQAEFDELLDLLQGIQDGDSVSLSLAAGGSEMLFAFYQPVIFETDGFTIDVQYPDWFHESSTQGQAHTFGRDDHVNFTSEFAADVDGPTFQYQLVGGSTYDSDIDDYRGLVDNDDVSVVVGTILGRWPTRPGDPAWDPTTDVNIRFPNGAEKGTGEVWPFNNPKEVGLGDYGTLNVEIRQARNPFLDLDFEARGTDYDVTYTGDTISPMDSSARFGNADPLVLHQLTATIRSNSEAVAGDQIQVPTEFTRQITLNGTTVTVISFPPDSLNGNTTTINTGIVVLENGPSSVRLETNLLIDQGDFPVGEEFVPGDIDIYTEVLHRLTFTAATSATSRTVVIQFQAEGGSEFSSPVDQSLGNLALSRIHIPASSAPPVTSTATRALPAEAQTAGDESAGPKFVEDEPPSPPAPQQPPATETSPPISVAASPPAAPVVAASTTSPAANDNRLKAPTPHAPITVATVVAAPQQTGGPRIEIDVPEPMVAIPASTVLHDISWAGLGDPTPAAEVLAPYPVLLPASPPSAQNILLASAVDWLHEANEIEFDQDGDTDQAQQEFVDPYSVDSLLASL